MSIADVHLLARLLKGVSKNKKVKIKVDRREKDTINQTRHVKTRVNQDLLALLLSLQQPGQNMFCIMINAIIGHARGTERCGIEPVTFRPVVFGGVAQRIQPQCFT